MSAVTLKEVSAPGFSTALNLAIGDREFVVLTGPDDGGISAVLRSIAGLTDATGDILFDERRMNDVAASDRDVAFVSRDYVPYPSISVFENLAIGLRQKKFAETEIKKRVNGAAEALGLQNLMPSLPATLSADELGLVALARAMVRQPKVFLFDRPFADLTPAAATRGRAEITKLHQRGAATIVFATHDPVEALAFGQRTVVIDSGGVQQDDRALGIFNNPVSLVAAQSLGEPPINLVEGSLKQERESLVFSESGDGTIVIRFPVSVAAGDVAGRQIILGFRPQDIEIATTASGPTASRQVFRALVERAEPRGTETELYLRTGAHDLVCRSRRWTEQGEGGHRFDFEIAEGKAYLFDAKTGARVTPSR